PLGAWRAFLGLRTSWMSREIAAFGLFAGAAATFTGAAAWPWMTKSLPLLASIGGLLDPARFASPLSSATAALAVLGIFCSAMIYIDTRRVFWSAPLVFIKFFGTAVVLGAAGCAAVLGWVGAPDAARIFAIAVMVMRTALFGWEAMDLRDGVVDPEDPNH